jgi:hypothetical protein
MQPVSKQCIHKRVSVAMNMNKTMELFWKWSFLLGPCEGVILKTTWATQFSCQLRVQFCIGGCENRT